MTCENLHIGFCRSIPDLYRMIVEAKGDALTLLNGRYGTIWSIFPVHKSSAFFSSPTVVDDHCSAKPRLIREKRRGLLEVHQKRIQGDLTVIEETREIVLCLSVRGGNTPQRLSLSLEMIEHGWSPHVRPRSSEQWRDPGRSRRDGSRSSFTSTCLPTPALYVIAFSRRLMQSCVR